jgi:hypothetical protein
MSFGALNRATIHPSVFGEMGRPIPTVEMTRRSHGALRYRCPVTGGFLLITDDETLRRLSQPPVRIRCSDCREMHLLVAAQNAERPASIVPSLVTK